MPNVPSTQPAIMKPTEEHPAYTQIAKVSSCYVCKLILEVTMSVSFTILISFQITIIL